MNKKKSDILQDETYILKKDLDWSVLNEGFSIPITYQIGFYEQIKKNLKHEEPCEEKRGLEKNKKN